METVVVLNLGISVPNKRTTLFSAVNRSFSFFSLESFSRERLSSATDSGIVYKFKSFQSARPDNLCTSRDNFESFPEQYERLIERPLPSSCRIFVIVSVNDTFRSTFALTRVRRAQTCSSNRARIKFRFTDLSTLSAFATLTSSIRLSAFSREISFQALTSSACRSLTSSMTSSCRPTVILSTDSTSAIRSLVFSSSVENSAASPPGLAGTFYDGAASTST